MSRPLRAFFLAAVALALSAAALALSAAAPAAPGDQTLSLDPLAPGPRFDGIGAVSGGGATSVLLKDYPEPQRSQILDLLFRPNYGASMSTLYVEVPGDGNSTQGTEPSHMHSRDDENYSRGYEWWIMREAKKRNPDLTLDACAWSCPGWVGNGQFWSQDMCDYYAKWIAGLKKTYGLDLDAVGCRNERGAVEPFVKRLRQALDRDGLQSVKIHAFDGNGPQKWEWCGDLNTDAALRDSVDIISNHTMSVVPAPADVQALARKLGKPIWNTEEHIYSDSEHTYGDDFDCALGMVHQFNANFIESGVTKIVNWYLVGSVYDIEPYAIQPPPIIANSPWSGHFSIKPTLWSYAHYGQFTKVGWHYVPQACQKLSGGGTVVALASDGGEFSVIAETGGASGPQTLRVIPLLRSDVPPLCVWRSNRQKQFVRQADITPDGGGCTITLDPNSIYSISTTTGQQKAEVSIPAERPFPMPYLETFDHYARPNEFGYEPHYTADICGVFEIADRPDGAGKCLRQVLSSKAQSWAPEWKPYTVLGDRNWRDYEVSADIFLDNGGWAGVMGRVNNTGNGWDGDPDGYYFRVYADGGCALYLANQRIKGSRDRELAWGEARDWRFNRWHNVKLRFEGKHISAWVDGMQTCSADDDTEPRGMAGLITSGEGNDRTTADFDNVMINTPGAARPEPTVFKQDAEGIYR